MDGWTAARVRKLRERLGESQEAFARRLGVSWVTVSRWENGHGISPLGQRALDAVAREKKK